MIIYALKVLLFWLASYLFYILLLKRETYFRINRVFLLGSLILGVIVPFINLGIGVDPLIQVVQLPTIIVGNNFQLNSIDSIYRAFNFHFYISILLIIGALILSIKMMIGLYKLWRLVDTGNCQYFENYIIVSSDTIRSPMSFLNYIFWNSELSIDSEDGKRILYHEYTHVVQKHSYDLLFVELLKLIFWWNPLIYLYKKELLDVHEYLADEAVVSQTNRQQYGQMLISQAMSYMQEDNVALANYFFHSQLKKRIEMLTRKKSSQHVILKYLLFIPMLLVLMYSCADGQVVPLDNQQKNETVKPVIAYAMTDTIVVFDPATFKESISYEKSDVYKVVEHMPMFRGCDDELRGKELYNCAQQKMLKFLYSNVSYPKLAREKSVEGTVVVQFVVYSDGEIGDVKIIRSIGFGCDIEVIRIVESMPKWIPGKQSGEEVNVQYVLPVKFKLS